MQGGTPKKPAASARRGRIDGQRRREELLDAALRCFDRKGVLGVGIEDVRREAGASPSSVYHQFADLEELMLALLVRVFTELFAHLAARVGRARTAEGAVRALVEGHLEWIAAHEAEGRFMYQAMTLEVGGLGKSAHRVLAEAKAEALRPLEAHLAPFIARGELPSWPPALLDVVLLGPSHEALRRWLGGAEELDPERLRAMLPTLAWRSIAKSKP
ncbi:MAG: TetR/AcrR family transcriptional regulator [Polyangiaceae bacterium]